MNLALFYQTTDKAFSLDFPSYRHRNAAIRVSSSVRSIDVSSISKKGLWNALQ
ncbi:hypothetical protein BBOMB_1582 [Bifidobacterium bombi DSM 19703]|uniref:Uncharacterized protein n=1 Tax=Bifidobacterium bombi DSM 19703 TaxID=1341695 RepID=A0A086BNE0_9BIFI|nr:hypothetical protein BBOMB_1582 [Bifidobacterium bombi DSM 19703]